MGLGPRTAEESAQLAIDDGIPLCQSPFAPWPNFEQDEIEAVNAVLRSGKVNYWTGLEGRLFEREFALYTGSRHAIALANGSLALELALFALDIGPGDEVVVTSRTFIASASCAVLRGATPVIADVDPDSQLITAASIERVLTSRTRAIIPVHLAGWPCEMDDILALARKHGLRVIEDCAQSVGARYKGKASGSMGDCGVFSFCQDKIMTTGGEGGMLVTDSTELWEKAWAYKDHGKSFSAVYERAHAPGFRWLHESFGTNWRITEMQSAIGRRQLQKLPQWLATRRRNAAILDAGFASIPGLRLTRPPSHVEHAYYKYYAFLRPEMLRPDWDQARVFESISAEGIPCNVGSCSEIYLEQAFVRAGLGPKERLPVARRLGETSLVFQVHPTLTEQDMLDTCAAVEKIMRVACA